VDWPAKPIGEFAEVKGGKRLPAGKLVQDEPTAYRYLRVTDFRSDGLDTTNIKYLDEESQSKISRYIINDDEVYISIAGTIGLVGIIPSELNGANLTENAAKICEIQPQVEPRFLMYYLRTRDGQGQISSQTVGTSQPKLALFRIKEIKVPVPPLPVQRRIAGILSAYDELLENNRRRIRLLEAMARALYREWFVRPCQAGKLPKGWETKTAPECIDINPRVTIPRDGEHPFVPMTSLATDSMLINDIESRTGNSGAKFQNGDTLFARITPCLENGKTAFVQFLPNAQSVAFGSTEFIVLRSRTLTPEFVYCLARSDEFRGNAIKSMSGATGRQRVQERCFDGFRIAQPPRALLERFTEIVAPSFRLIHNLHQRNQNLRRTRDLLLPRLLSGQVKLETS